YCRVSLYTTASPTSSSRLSLRDALPIYHLRDPGQRRLRPDAPGRERARRPAPAGRDADGPGHRRLQDGPDGRHRLRAPAAGAAIDRKSTRLNSSHVKISYAVFRLHKNIE